jgi:hypothetical protein
MRCVVADEKPLKSAYELAMERLRARDREQGAGDSTPLTQDQKEEIARLRQEAKAKLAEIEILHRDALRAATDPESVTKLEEQHRIDRERITSRLETAIARVRRGEV